MIVNWIDVYCYEDQVWEIPNDIIIGSLEHIRNDVAQTVDKLLSDSKDWKNINEDNLVKESARVVAYDLTIKKLKRNLTD